ncbi:hypothetical protein RB195_012875 [Necator americanus]|uniref:MMS19 nucleotide excision repair protein n=1 Tax=Necator americanus TaxID=51031 RepID=A0ABR1DSY1_NECAM
MPPSSKRLRYAEQSADEVRRTVAQALLSDDTACAALLEDLVGLEEKVVDALMTLLKTLNPSEVNLSGPISNTLRKYFALIGVSTATERFKELYNVIESGNGAEYVSNFAILMCQLVRFSNVIQYDKLLQEVITRLPSIISTLWGNGFKTDACTTSRLFAELLLATRSYRAEERVKDLWFEQVITKDTRRCPYFATLSLLLSSDNRKHIDDLVEASALQKLPTSERGNMCLRTQMSDVILCYFSSLYNRCSRRQMEVFLDFVLLHGFEMRKISNVIEELMHCIDKMANDVPAYQLMANSIMRLLLKHMFATNSEPFLDDYLDFLRNIQHCEGDEKKSSEHLKNIAHFLDHVVKNKWAPAFSVSPAVKSLVSAFFGLPLQFSSEPSRGYYLAAAFLLINVFKSSDDALFKAGIRMIRDLIRGIESNVSLNAEFSTLELFFNNCLYFLKGLPNGDATWKDVASILCVVVTSNTDKSDAFYHCPALTYMEHSRKDFSWAQVVSLSVLFMSTRWKELLKCSKHDKQQLKIVKKIRLLLSTMLSTVPWDDKEQVRSVSEQLCILYVYWDFIPRSVRPSVMKKLLTEEDVKLLSKLTTRIISGKIGVEKKVLESAINFYLKYIPILCEGIRPLEEVLGYDSLVCLLRSGVSLDVILAQFSVEKVMELLRFCSTNVEHPQENLNIITFLISSKLKDVAGDALAPLASTFENYMQIGDGKDLLLLAANALEIFAHTDIERDVVDLCFSFLSVQPLPGTDFERIRCVQKVLDSAIRYAHPSVNNDQCAVFVQQLIKVFNAVRHFIIHHCGTAEETEELVHGLNSLAHAITLHRIYYSRIVGAMVSAVIYPQNDLEFAVYKLHDISDKHSASMLATNLPPAERLQYKRIFTSLKKARKLIV